jgi:hypothetical protein
VKAPGEGTSRSTQESTLEEACFESYSFIELFIHEQLLQAFPQTQLLEAS